LYESNTIARYVARSGSNNTIYSGSNYELSLVDQGMDVVRSLESNLLAGWLYPLLGYGVYDKAAIERNRETTLNRWFRPLNTHLGTKKFMAGDRMTLADICLFCCLVNPMKMALGPEIRESIPNIMEWFNRCSGEANFKEVVGEFELCKEEPKEPIKRS